MRRLIQSGAVLAFLLLPGAGAHSVPAEGQTDPPAAGMPETARQEAEPPVPFERSDCVLKDAVCRSECAYNANEARCIARICEHQFLQCTASLPVGKVVSLPVACMTADQEAMRLLERQGELLDADPTLFGESFNVLVRARIACRAGRFTEGLNFYDEIQESLRVKRVPEQAAGQAGN